MPLLLAGIVASLLLWIVLALVLALPYPAVNLLLAVSASLFVRWWALTRDGAVEEQGGR